MKPNRLMQERIRRVALLIKELGHDLEETEADELSYSGVFAGPDGFQTGVFIDADSKFLEFAYTFAFSIGMAEYVRERLEDILHALYEFGSYFSIHTDQHEIVLTVFTKIYFAGLNYFALKETLRDFREAVGVLHEILEIPEDREPEESYGDT